MIVEAIRTAAEGGDLSEDLAGGAMEAIMSGEATPAQTAALLVALRMKGETAGEIAGLARVMRAKALRVQSRWPDLVDTCGTGGTAIQTFNVSTGAAFVAAGAGAKVAKHGNRGMSSPCGSFDVLEALGLRIQLSPEEVGRCIDEAEIGFMFAQAFHPAMKHAAPVRREIGIRTVFNLLGPLTNPAGATRQVMGVPRKELTTLLAEALISLGATHALVVYGEPGLGEFSTLGPTHGAEVREGNVRTFTVTPEELGLETASREAIAGGTPEENAAVLTDLLHGAKGPKRDLLLLNAGAALVAAGLAGDLKEGLSKAADSVDSGAAWAKLEELRALIPRVPVAD
ncbi:MAG: anthranilate phosphoribosyltransferase [Armatimonadetes bacterium]|nr:anthranilate phosphoribosyltransferase [Armatimonadota bacterium]